MYAGSIDPPCLESEPDAPQCMPFHWVTPITMTAYLIFCNILLLSILIATFNNTYIRISKSSDQVWKYHRYYIILKYESKPMLPPPLIVFSHLLLLIKIIIRCCRGKKFKVDHGLSRTKPIENVRKMMKIPSRIVLERKGSGWNSRFRRTTDRRILRDERTGKAKHNRWTDCSDCWTVIESNWIGFVCSIGISRLVWKWICWDWRISINVKLRIVLFYTMSIGVYKSWKRWIWRCVAWCKRCLIINHRCPLQSFFVHRLLWILLCSLDTMVINVDDDLQYRHITSLIGKVDHFHCTEDPVKVHRIL